MASSPSSRKRPRLDPDPALPIAAAEERRLFRLWVEASRLGAASAARRAQHPDGKEAEADRKARRAAHDAYLDALAALGLEERGLAYDPLSRRFVNHRAGLDPRPSSKLFFQYHPVAAAAACHPSEAAPHGAAYELLVTNHDTKRKAPPCTVATLERYLPRRYRGARPRRVGVLRPAGAGGEVECRVEGVECRVYDMAAAEGHGFNCAFLRAVEEDGCEVVYVSRSRAAASSAAAGEGEQEAAAPVVLTDAFFPTYPTLLDGGRLLLLGPLHVYQVDGAASEARDAMQSLLDRACGVLGAVVADRASASRLPYMRYDRQRHQREQGLAHARATAAAAAAAAAAVPSPPPSIEADARALRITGRLWARRYVPTFAHGWLSDDTAILLATVLRVFRPRGVLELGAWLGLSSRFILREGKGSVRRFVSVDHFKNTAVGNTARLEDVASLDKLYFSHLRFETFYANMEVHCFESEESGDDGGAAAAAAAKADAPEVVMLRANVHEAPQLLHSAGEAVDLVFIDAEKDAGRLARLLRTVQRLYPRAVIVGDDLAFAGVKQALVDVGVPEARLVTRAEAYVILPAEVGEGEEEGAGSRDKAAVLAAMEEEVAPQLAVPAWQREVVALIEQGKDAEAAALGAAHGLGPGDVLYSPGKSILHDVCRRRDEAALAFLDRYVKEELLGKGLKAEEEEGRDGGKEVPKALIPVNDVGLTPFDYLVDKINF